VQDSISHSDELVATPIPALLLILLNLEGKKGSDLTEREVIEMRDNCTCIMLPRSAKEAAEEKRGYRDLELEDVWEDWLAYKSWAAGSGE
jgi:hypothetical protein